MQKTICDHEIAFSLLEIQKLLSAVSEEFYLNCVNGKFIQDSPIQDQIYEQLESAAISVNNLLDKNRLTNR